MFSNKVQILYLTMTFSYTLTMLRAVTLVLQSLAKFQTDWIVHFTEQLQSKGHYSNAIGALWQVIQLVAWDNTQASIVSEKSFSNQAKCLTMDGRG